ncbi:MAG: NifB/NifX family molybdenum-iron cluster-binding protein [Bacteroidota bacterium]|nr:NifB/NifX family molybdenum-iron cluster-binding protein [Bacteroidota bacterium]
MIIAISSTERNWTDMLDDRFGRARGFVLVDAEHENTSWLDNTDNGAAAHGAGTATVQMLIDAGVECVIAGRVGPKASDALSAAGIPVVLVDAGLTVAQAWKQYQKQMLS